jgi:hypothetical protein
MINLAQQKEIYKMLFTHLGFEHSDISMPVLVLDHTLNEEVELAFSNFEAHEGLPPRPWFDLLGWFSAATPNQVGLRPEAIQRAAQQLACSPLYLAQLVYAHELGHYFHHVVNPRGFLQYPIVERTTYVETFAQLCTHAVARNLDSFGSRHQAIFEEMCDCQPAPYTYFRKHELHLLAREVVVEYFLHPTEGELLPLSALNELQQTHLRSLVRQREDYEPNADSVLDLALDLNTMGFDKLDTWVTNQPFQNMAIR